MTIKNPTKNDVSIVIKGNQYTILAEGKLDISEAHAIAWKEIHEFLIIDNPKETKMVEAEESIETTKKVTTAKTGK